MSKFKIGDEIEWWESYEYYKYYKGVIQSVDLIDKGDYSEIEIITENDHYYYGPEEGIKLFDPNDWSIQTLVIKQEQDYLGNIFRFKNDPKTEYRVQEVVNSIVHGNYVKASEGLVLTFEMLHNKMIQFKYYA